MKEKKKNAKKMVEKEDFYHFILKSTVRLKIRPLFPQQIISNYTLRTI